MECSNFVLILEAIFITLAIYIPLELGGRCLNRFLERYLSARQFQTRQENLEWLAKFLALNLGKTDSDPTAFEDLEKGNESP